MTVGFEKETTASVKKNARVYRGYTLAVTDIIPKQIIQKNESDKSTKFTQFNTME